MLALLLYILCAVAFLQLFRLGQQRQARIYWVGVINYAAATVFSLGRWWGTGAHWDPQAALIGAGNGTLYWLHLLVVLACFGHAGVGITGAVANSANVLPVLAAWWLWNEPMTPARWAAVALVPVAMFLLRPPRAKDAPWTPRADVLLTLNFLLAGTITTIHKSADMLVSAEVRPTYNVALFTCAMLAGVLTVSLRPSRPRPLELKLGVVIGTVNGTVLMCLLWALSQLPTAVVYLAGSVAVLLLNLGVGWRLWGERVTQRQLVGVVAALGIVLLLRM